MPLHGTSLSIIGQSPTCAARETTPGDKPRLQDSGTRRSRFAWLSPSLSDSSWVPSTCRANLRRPLTLDRSPMPPYGRSQPMLPAPVKIDVGGEVHRNLCRRRHKATVLFGLRCDFWRSRRRRAAAEPAWHQAPHGGANHIAYCLEGSRDRA